VTEIGGQVGWSTLSDARLKTNVHPSSLGLDFIRQLQPVTYNYIDTGQAGILYTGFISLRTMDTMRSSLARLSLVSVVME
jgi:hypothetical protein